EPSASPGLISRGSSCTVRAISGPLASRDQDVGRTVLIVAAPRLLGLGMCVDRVRDRLVSALGLVLVDQCGPFAFVSHPCYQVAEPGATLRRELVSRVAQVVKM